LGCSVGSSKSQLHKARKRLRQLLQGEQVPVEADIVRAQVRSLL
jgi:DNA-directed RNA polymerase specialized sigma24 family protein